MYKSVGRCLGSNRRNPTRSSTLGQRGFTLIEVMMAVAVLGLTLVGAVAGSVAVGTATVLNMNQVQSGLLVTNVSERLERTPYINCATAASYASALPLATKYSATIVSVEYLANKNADPQVFQSSCPGNPDQGIQRVTIRVSPATGGIGRKELMKFYMRRSTCPTPWPTVAGQTC